MRFFARKVGGLLGLLLAFSSVNAYAAVQVLTFDEFAVGQVIDDEYFAQYGVTIDSVNYNNSSYGSPYGDTDQNNNYQGYQVAFDTSLSNTQDPDLEYAYLKNPYTPLTIEEKTYSSTPGNILILHENPSTCENGVCKDPDDEGNRSAGYFTFDFMNPVTILNIDFFDVEDKAGQHEEYFTIYFYDSGNNVIKSPLVPTMKDSEWARVSYNIANVSRIKLSLPGSGGIDNVAFKATQVSAPSSFAIIFAGLGAVIALRRRSRSA